MRRSTPVAALLFVILLPAAALAAEQVSLRTSDGRVLSGEFHRAGEARGGAAVLALHMFLGDRTQFAGVGEEFTKRGVSFLAIDLRGHGKSPGLEGDRAAVGAREPKAFTAMRKDVDAAMSWLAKEGYDGGRVGLLGGSLGACLAVDRMGRDDAAPCAVLLTPLSSYPGLDPVGSAGKTAGRSILLVSSRDDASRGTEAIWSALPGEDAELRLIEKNGTHGTALLKSVPELPGELADWFDAHLAGGITLDGVLSSRETGRAEVRPLGDDGSLYVRRLPNHIWFGARGSGARALLLSLGKRDYVFDAKGIGRDGEVLPLPGGVIRAVGEDAVEVLLRLGTFGLDRGGELRISARLRSAAGESKPAEGVRLFYPKSTRHRDE